MENKVSVIIPARNEIYLEKTVRNILENAEGDIEVLIALDGWVPNPQIVIGDERVVFYHFKDAIGHLAATNELAKVAKGKFIMKLDAHCAVGKGFDVILARDCEYDMTMIPRMYNLDVETWKPRYFDNWERAIRQRKCHDYLYIYINERGELRTQYYPSHENKKLHYERKDILIDETMSCMGPCFFMHKDRFFELDGCDTTGGRMWGQQAVELACKAWLSGGKLMVNKKTWFAHWFRGGQGWPYPISGNHIDKVRKHSKELWLNDKWPLAKRKFMWMVEKFNPPGWEKENIKVEQNQEIKKDAHFGDYPTPEEKMFIYKKMFWHIFKRNNFIRWRGHIVLKMPSDLMLYQRAIKDNKPDFIIETGCHNGGSAFYFADICELNKRGHVIAIDINDKPRPAHPRITYLIGDSKSDAVVNKVKEMVGNKSVMASLDSDHSFNHVTAELEKYAPIVTRGQFMVVEDCYGKFGEEHQPFQAINSFLQKTNDFVLTDYDDRFLIGISMGGWLKKV